MKIVTEADLLRAVLLVASRLGAKLWRNNVGVLRDVRGGYVTYGVGNPGGSDLIGYRTVTVTPEMVGTTIAQFVALEVKGSRGRVSDEQRQFVRVARASGALAGIVWVDPPRHTDGDPPSDGWMFEDVEIALWNGRSTSATVDKS